MVLIIELFDEKDDDDVEKDNTLAMVREQLLS